MWTELTGVLDWVLDLLVLVCVSAMLAAIVYALARHWGCSDETIRLRALAAALAVAIAVMR